jgi:hypothetical protein
MGGASTIISSRFKKELDLYTVVSSGDDKPL